MQPFTQISPEETRTALETGEYFLLDIRTEGEVLQFWEIHWTKARYDIYEPSFWERVLKLPKDGKYIIYCWHGNRSQVARDWMKEQGFTWVVDLAGGIDAWKY